MRRALGFLIGLVLACDAAIVAVRLLDRHTDVFAARVARPPITRTVVVPAANQAFLSGELERMTASGAQATVLATPVTLVAVERGVGRATIEGALVGGRRVTISWDGGTPLPITGEGGVDLGRAGVEVGPEGLAWSVDGEPRRLLPGSYRLGAPVAAAAAGLAEPRTGVEFEADERTAVVAHGPVVIRRDRAAVALTGPGSLELRGRLDVRLPDGQRAGTVVRLEEGPFELALEPTGTAWRVEGVLQGRVSVSG